MSTGKQILGADGEKRVIQNCICPKCKRPKTLRPLAPNFKCADVICDFCGYLAQVKTRKTEQIEKLPKTILGGAWGVQRDRMHSGIYFPLFLVQIDSNKDFAIFYLSADLQTPRMFIPREPLGPNARRAGWQGFFYDLTRVPNGAIIRLVNSKCNTDETIPPSQLFEE